MRSSVFFFLFIIMTTLHACRQEVLESYSQSWLSAGGTWYGDPRGYGTSGGACGYGDLAQYGYNVVAASDILFKNGAGCGTCYEVVCIKHSACSPTSIKVVITDECPNGYLCANNKTHFDMGGKAFGNLAFPGKDVELRNRGIIDIQYKRIPCNRRENIALQIDLASNPYWLAFVVKFVAGAGSLKSIFIQKAGSTTWTRMKHNWGASWYHNGLLEGPLSVLFFASIGNQAIVATNCIPEHWEVGELYDTGVQFKI